MRTIGEGEDAPSGTRAIYRRVARNGSWIYIARWGRWKLGFWLSALDQPYGDVFALWSSAP